jgi:hypothetical protein
MAFYLTRNLESEVSHTSTSVARSLASLRTSAGLGKELGRGKPYREISSSGSRLTRSRPSMSSVTSWKEIALPTERELDPALIPVALMLRINSSSCRGSIARNVSDISCCISTVNGEHAGIRQEATLMRFLSGSAAFDGVLVIGLDGFDR